MPFIVLTVLPQPTSAMDGSNMFHAAVKQVRKECTIYINTYVLNTHIYIYIYIPAYFFGFRVT